MRLFTSVLYGTIISIAYVLLLPANISIVLKILFILMSAALFGLIVVLQLNNPTCADPDINRRNKFQFGLLRLLLATSVVALVFGLSKILYDFKQPAEIIISSIVAISLGILTLICNKHDLKHIIGIVIVVLIGIFYVIAMLRMRLHGY